MNPAWAGQAATAFSDNWTIGMSFYHNVFAREHNVFVDAFRKKASEDPNGDSGLRNPANPNAVIAYKDVTDDELFEVTRLVVSAMIAKIHTIEWTTQLLYNEPLYLGMNANWGGLFKEDSRLGKLMAKITTRSFGKSDDAKKATQCYSVFASGPGIFGLGSHIYQRGSFFDLFNRRKKDVWDLSKPDHVNGGINHFGSPFNFPEEFTTVYRLHPLVPDLMDFREWQDDPNVIRNRIPVVKTFRGKATAAMRERGLANWALSMGRQRLGFLKLQNHAQFFQNLSMPRLKSETKKIDIAALDLIRDRERGLPRFNEFRRQYGLRQLTSFDDFIDPHTSSTNRTKPKQNKRNSTIKRRSWQPCARSMVNINATTRRSSPIPNATRMARRSLTASGIPMVPWWTISKMSTPSLAGWRNPPDRTALRFRKRNSWCLFSTPHGACSAIAFSPPVSVRNSTPSSELIG